MLRFPAHPLTNTSRKQDGRRLSLTAPFTESKTPHSTTALGVENQKFSFMPSCMMRGSRVLVTWLNTAEVAVSEPQQIGFVWLNVLKVSQRSWPVRRSVNLMFLNSERSVRQKPGARTEPGRLEATVVCVAPGAAKAATLNQPV